MDYNDWEYEVNRIMRDRVATTVNDLGIDLANLVDAFIAKEEPSEYVDNYIKRYDLTTKAEIGI